MRPLGRLVGNRATTTTLSPASRLSVLSRLLSATLYVNRKTPMALSPPTNSSRAP
jgi:hypothetical protein